MLHPDFDDVRAIIRDANNCIFSVPDACKFLEGHHPKDFTLRLISWLMVLHLIPESQSSIPAGFTDIIMEYSHPSCPPVASPSEESLSMIECDIPRSTGWFVGLARSSSLPQQYYVDGEGIARRILRRLASTPDFVYYQGFDRYVLIASLVSLHFSAAQGLPASIGEAVAFSLSRSLLQAANLPQYLGETACPSFSVIDSALGGVRPDLDRQLKDFHATALCYASGWKLVWFADEHSVDGILQIWDNILARLDVLPSYLNRLSLAHLHQVEVPEGMLALEGIQRYTNWNVSQIIEKAKELNLEGPNREELKGTSSINGSRAVSSLSLARPVMLYGVATAIFVLIVISVFLKRL
jgi:hypothetical protein